MTRPLRTATAAGALAAALTLCAGWPARGRATDFATWLEAFTAEARSQGISQRTLDAAFRDTQPIPRVIELDRHQPEGTVDFCSYLRRRLTKRRVARARALYAQHRRLLARARREHGVPGAYLIALWAIESNFGQHQGTFKVIDALATLAHDGRRAALFRRQLLAALRIVEQGHKPPADMKGSWAGAMGQVQFMPTTFLDNAVDGDGDGRKDIWNSVPDALLSAANYLKNAGWRRGQTWGREVRVPRRLRRQPGRLARRRGLSAWRRLGVRRANGRPLPRARVSGSIVSPKGGEGATFLVYDNYRTIKRWNNSDFFAVTVGALADAIAGRPRPRACRR